MPIRVKWDRFEVALLIDTYVRVANGADSNVEAARLSQKLRDLAVRRGITIDDTYRNVNGMKMQLANVHHLFTDKKHGLTSPSAMMIQMYELYKTKPEEYQAILKEAIQLTSPNESVEDSFLAYAEERTSLTPTVLTDHLRKAAEYCALTQPLLGMTDVVAVRNVAQKLSKSILFRFKYGKDAQAIRDVTKLYCAFIDGYSAPKHESVVQKTSVEEEVKPAQPVPTVETVVEETTPELPTECKPDADTVAVEPTSELPTMRESGADTVVVGCSSEPPVAFESKADTVAVGPIPEPPTAVLVDLTEEDETEYDMIKTNVAVLREDITAEETDGRLWVDFSQDNIQPFTKPVAYVYKGVRHEVNSWKALYVEVCGLLFADHREAFLTLINGDIPGYNAIAFADGFHYYRMRTPVCFAPGYYLETNRSSTWFVQRLSGLHRFFGLTDELQIEYRLTEDYLSAEPKASRTKNDNDQPSADEDYDWARKDLLLVDLINNASYTFTRPDAYEYKGVTRRVNTWGRLYVELCGALFDDYRDVFMSMMNGDIPGCKSLTFADEQHRGRMNDPRRFAPGFYLEAKVDATTIVRKIRGLYRLFDLGDSLRIAYIKPGMAKAVEDPKEPDEDWLIRELRARNLLYVDKRSKGGCLWIPIEPALTAVRREAVNRGYHFSTKLEGCSAFPNRPVIWTKDQPKEPAKPQVKDVPKPASPWTVYEAVLRQAFPKGFQKESVLDIKKLRKRWAETYGVELKDADEAIRSQLAAHCVDTGKRWYLEELLLSDEDRQNVLRYIDQVLESGKTVLYYSSIYAALEHQLESTVLTEDRLVSYLRATCRDRYILRDLYLTNDPHAQVDISEEIKAVMVAYGRPIHTDELKQALHHLPPQQVDKALHLHPEFIKDSIYEYFHESMAVLTEQELEQIAAFIQEELDEQGYMIGDWIQQKLERLYPETAERLNFLSLLGVRGAVAYKLRDRFTFSGPVITPKGKAMNMVDVFALFCQHHAPFTLDELTAFAKKCDSVIYWDTVHRNCVRVRETNFVATDAVRWDIPHTDAAIALRCPGKYVSLNSIRYFDAFPFVGYPWNSYLLEQYVATVSKDFALMHSSFAKSNTSGAIVRRDAGFGSFDELLEDVLANAPVTLESVACLAYLATEGYITRKKISNLDVIIARAKSLRSQKG